MEFCPECSNMLTPHELCKEKILKMRCATCDYSQPANTLLVFNRNLKTMNEGIVNWDEIVFDQTLQHSFNTPCPIPDCYGTETLLYQLQTAEGFKSYSMCVQCHHYWTC